MVNKIDLSKCYWQVPLAPGAREKTAFQTHVGHFQWLVMHIGLVTAPATFSRLMREFLKGIQGVVNYLDDILVFTPNWTEHMNKLEKLLNRLLGSD